MQKTFVGQKGDEMTEVVTSIAASSQLNLLAQRQQVFGIDRPTVERQGVDSSFNAADTAPSVVDTSADNLPQFSAKSDDENPVNRHQEQPAPQPRPEPVSGPSRARIEIKHIDLGLTPSEVVGTPDILQRFDTNGDGRVDLIEAARAGVAREGVFTFAGLAAQGSDTQPTDAAIAATVALESSPSDGVPTAPPAGPTGAVEKKLFTPADVPGAAQARRHFVQTAAEGTASGVADAPKKFSGQGAEVVVGKFAADLAPKIADKADTKTTTVTEDGTGETKVYDKVAQSETDTPSGDTTDNQKPSPEQHPQKVAQLAAYAEAAAAAAAVRAAVKAITA